MAVAFPFIPQLDSMDCGSTCLQTIFAYYNPKYSACSLRGKCFCNQEGVSMMGLSDVAESFGFHTQSVKLSWEQLREEALLPCVIHWNQNHFIVVYLSFSRNCT